MKKVYLDYNVWDKIHKKENPEVRIFFEKQAEQNGWKYYLSTAHLEELYRARKGEAEKRQHIGETDALEATMCAMSESGVIKPSETVEFFKGKNEYLKAKQAIEVEHDTREIVYSLADERDYEVAKTGDDPKCLFKGVTHVKADEHESVWNLTRIKEAIEKENKNRASNRRKLPCLLEYPDMLCNDPQFRHLYDEYGFTPLTRSIIFKRMRRKNIFKNSYSELKKSYVFLEDDIDTLFKILADHGFKREKSDYENKDGEIVKKEKLQKMFNSEEYDISHAILSTYCDVLVTCDQNFVKKYKAVAYYLGIPIEIKLLSELIAK